jgi:2-keto-3-deoxy-L-rhamnonate aldolase RhmA
LRIDISVVWRRTFEEDFVNGRELSEALRTGGPVFGTLIVSPSPRWHTALEGSGLDFVFIDTEHIALDRSQVSWMCQLYSQAKLAPLVRIAEPNSTLATMALDGGAAGVIAPYVESAAQVRELVGAVKCRPLKGRRLKQILDGESIEPALRRYIERHNSHHVLIVNVESVPAVEALDDILAVPGLDGVLIGPHDLSCSLGIPEQYDHPRFDAAVRDIIDRARKAQIGAGIHFWGNQEQEVKWLRSGLNMLIHSGDITLFAKHLRNELAEIKAGFARGTGNSPVLRGPHQAFSEEMVVPHEPTV